MAIFTKLAEFVAKSYRVWQITRKPTKDEFKLVSKASALGILIIGFIGFAVAALFKLFFK